MGIPDTGSPGIGSTAGTPLTGVPLARSSAGQLPGSPGRPGTISGVGHSPALLAGGSPADKMGKQRVMQHFIFW